MNTILDTQDTAYDIIKISTSIDHGEMSASCVIHTYTPTHARTLTHNTHTHTHIIRCI